MGFLMKTVADMKSGTPCSRLTRQDHKEVPEKCKANRKKVRVSFFTSINIEDDYKPSVE